MCKERSRVKSKRVSGMSCQRGDINDSPVLSSFHASPFLRPPSPRVMLPRALLFVRWSRPSPLAVQVAVKNRRRSYGVITTQIREERWYSASSSPPSSGSVDGADAPDQLPCLREYIATLGVFFTLPEQGITSPEILTRCDSNARNPLSRLSQYSAASAAMRYCCCLVDTASKEGGAGELRRAAAPWDIGASICVHIHVRRLRAPLLAYPPRVQISPSPYYGKDGAHDRRSSAKGLRV